MARPVASLKMAGALQLSVRKIFRYPVPRIKIAGEGSAIEARTVPTGQSRNGTRGSSRTLAETALEASRRPLFSKSVRT